MDIFDEKDVKPMLIGADAEAFDDPDFLYELKLDGERAIVYLDPKHGTELRNKRNKRMLPIFPELSELHRQAKGRCILDGEYIVLKDGKPNFSEVQRRSLMSNPFKIRLAADKLPASFVAFDILYLDGAQLTGLPLTERKDILRGTVSESGRMAVSRVVERGGVELYKLTERAGLEGIVAKRRDSRYYLDKRTKDWIKCKNLLDDDFVVCGYIRKSDHMTSIVLGAVRRPRARLQGPCDAWGVRGGFPPHRGAQYRRRARYGSTGGPRKRTGGVDNPRPRMHGEVHGADRKRRDAAAGVQGIARRQSRS